MRIILFLVVARTVFGLPTQEASSEIDGESSRKILGSSVVTSVSVIMDTGNGSKAVYSDAVGKPMSKPTSGSELASPINLLNPDRYEFYTFDDNGDLVKRLMSLDEIQGIIATGDGDGFNFDSFTSDGYMPEKRVNDVVNNVQNVLKEEMETHKDPLDTKPMFDTPDVSDSWSMILPAIFGNSGEDIKPERPITHVTPDTIMLEPTEKQKVVLSSTASQESVSTTPRTTSVTPARLTTRSTSTTVKPTSPRSTSNTTPRSTTTTPIIKWSSVRPSSVFSTSTQFTTGDKLVLLLTKTPGTTILPLASVLEEEKVKPMINVEVHSNSQSTTEKQKDQQTTEHPVIEIKPVNFNLTKDQIRPIYHVSSTKKTTRKPSITTTKVAPILTAAPSIAVTFTRPSTTTTTPVTISASSTTTTTVPSTSTKVTTITNIPELSRTTLSTLLSSLTNEPLLLSSSVLMPSSTVKIPVTTEVEPAQSQNVLPTLAQLLNQQQDQPLLLSPTTESKPEATTTEVSLGDFTTFTILDGNQMKPENFATTNEPTEKNLEEDLSTLSSEFVTFRNNIVKEPVTSSSEDFTTTELPLDQTLNNVEKLSATELLDQLLLSSTNIYEINTELSKNPIVQEVTLKDDDRFETTTSQELKTTTLQESINTTPVAEVTTEFLINAETTEQPTTLQPTLLNSIEQLLSQAVGNIEEAVVNTNNSLKIQNMIINSSKKNMSDVQTETATLASSLVDSAVEATTSTEKILIEDFASADSSLFSDAVGSLLSQVYGGDESSLTTIEQMPFTTEKQTTIGTLLKTTAISNRKTDDHALPSTTKVAESAESTTIVDHVTDKYEEIDLGNETTAPEFSKNLTDVLNEKLPHIINITIISSEELKNISKPNKEEESGKNITKIAGNELLETEASGSIINNVAVTEIEETSEITTEVTTTFDKNNLITTILPQDDVATTEKPELVSSDEITTILNDPPTTTVIEDVTTTTEIIPETTTTTTDAPEITTIVINTTTTKIVTKTLPKNQTVAFDATTKRSPTLTSKPLQDPKPSILITINENSNQAYVAKRNVSVPLQNKPEYTWTLVPTVVPAHVEASENHTPNHPINTIVDPPTPVDLVPKPLQGFGLEDSTSKLDTDIYQFAQLCNELAFGFWKSVTGSISSARSVFLSPFSATSLLAMVFLGARGATSGEMNEILKLDDMVTFNPHLIFKNVSESIKAEQPDSGISSSAIIRELYSDKSKGKLLGFYKERVRQFYDGHVEEASFREIGDVIRRRSNLLIKKYSDGKLVEFLKDSSITARAPLAGIGINIFQTDCSQASTEGRDGELHFVVLPTIRQRRLIPIPAVVYRSGFLAGYEPSLDATAVALGTKDQTISTIFVIPGQQGIAAPGDGLARLEKRLVESSFKKGAWSRLLRSLIPRPGLEVQIPRFSHRSVINATVALKKMGLKDLFDSDKADLRGLNGVANELHLSDVLQINNFATCGEDRIGETHHSEVYPATASRSRSARNLEEYQSENSYFRGDTLEEPRDYQRAFHDPLHDPSYLSLPLPLRPRQARIPESPRLRFDRPFLYFVRHNPTGLILHMGRFNPRLLP